MYIEKLKIVNGIIQNEFIGGIPVYIDIIEPEGAANVRTLKPMNDILGTTTHCTDNYSPTATDSAHANHFQNVEDADKQYVGAAIFVDDDSFTQILPINEVAYHAGDGSGDGNYKTVSIEVCVNRDIEKAIHNSQILNAAFLITNPTWNLYKHQDWSGKYCPRAILNREGRWFRYVNEIGDIIEKNEVEKVPAMYQVGWDKAVAKGVEDGFGPNEAVTSAKLMTYFDKLGLLD